MSTPYLCPPCAEAEAGHSDSICWLLPEGPHDSGVCECACDAAALSTGDNAPSETAS